MITIDPNDPRLDTVMITTADARRAGHCPKGIKEWCRVHRLDMRTLSSPGYPARTILATGDAMGERVVQIKWGLLS